MIAPAHARPAAEVAKAFEALARSIKRISNYRHAKDKFGEFLQPAYLELNALLTRSGSFTVAVEPSALVFDREPVLNEPAREVSLCFRLHRDGVRKITFKPGLSFDELLSFARIALPDALEGADAGREDAAIELWKADLQSIEYEAVPIYEVARTDADRAQLGRIAAQVRDRLAAFGPTLPSDEDVHRALPPLCTLPERDGLDPQAGVHRLVRAAMLLVRIVERKLAGRDLDSLTEALGRLVDEMLRQGDGQALASTLARVGEPGAAEVAQRLAPRLGEPWRLARLAELCEQNIDLFIFGLPVYLAFLPADAGNALVAVLQQTEAKGVREAFSAAAVQRLQWCRASYEDGLQRGPPGAAKAMLAALSTLSLQERGTLGALALAHRDPSVQIEAVRFLASHDPRKAIEKLGEFLLHTLPDVRVAAAEALGGIRDDGAAQVLLQRMRSLEFGRAERAEREVFFEALGRQRTPAGFGFLSEKLTNPGRNNILKAKAVEDQLLAIRGLAADATERSLRVLEFAAHHDQQHPAVVVTACKAAAQHVRDALARPPELR